MAKKRKSMKGTSAFVLYQGRYMWDKVEAVLTSLGHTVYLPELPGHGANTDDLSRETSDSSAYKLAKQIEQLPGKVILVGCSRGGVWNTLIGELIPDKIEKIVYDSAWLLQPGESGNGCDGSGRHVKFWHEVSEDGVTLSGLRHPDPVPLTIGKSSWLASASDMENMARHSEGDIFDILYKRVYPTPYRWGTIRRFSINNTLDVDIDPTFMKIQCENLPCEKVYEMESDHISMLSHPEEMAYILHDIARQ